VRNQFVGRLRAISATSYYHDGLRTFNIYQKLLLNTTSARICTYLTVQLMYLYGIALSCDAVGGKIAEFSSKAIEVFLYNCEREFLTHQLLILRFSPSCFVVGVIIQSIPQVR